MDVVVRPVQGAFYAFEGDRPLHIGGPTALDCELRVKHFYKGANVSHLHGGACCASCAANRPCESGCGKTGAGHLHAHAHPHGAHAHENPLEGTGSYAKKIRAARALAAGEATDEPIFAVGEGDDDEPEKGKRSAKGANVTVACGDCGCATATPAAPAAWRFERVRKAANGTGGYEVVPDAEQELPAGLQDLFAQGACKGEACLPMFRVQPTDPEKFRAALEAARKLGPIDDPKKVARLLKKYLMTEEQEVFLCVSLDVHLRVRGIGPIARGARDSVMTPVADVLRLPIIDGASAFLVVHNHPSGSPKPSKADLEVTKAIKAGAEAVNILFLDHLVIAERGYYSFDEHKKA